MICRFRARPPGAARWGWRAYDVNVLVIGLLDLSLVVVVVVVVVVVWICLYIYIHIVHTIYIYIYIYTIYIYIYAFVYDLYICLPGGHSRTLSLLRADMRSRSRPAPLLRSGLCLKGGASF